YTTAVAWAVENGITTGMGDGTFGVNVTCNRAYAVTFLYRAFAE
ncbi:MAG: S-layer homology domain-containing protein, partial [Oscillospiraceae bacterium]|nr:S-layer homology domain-containing protein [Oscillospiraceae bacterium]